MPAPLAGLFAGSVRDVWLEIGFGGGEHLLWQAKAHPDVGLIGCEPFLDGARRRRGGRLPAAEAAAVSAAVHTVLLDIGNSGTMAIVVNGASN